MSDRERGDGVVTGRADRADGFCGYNSEMGLRAIGVTITKNADCTKVNGTHCREGCLLWGRGNGNNVLGSN
jgi:hypothetical protein